MVRSQHKRKFPIRILEEFLMFADKYFSFTIRMHELSQVVIVLFFFSIAEELLYSRIYVGSMIEALSLEYFYLK